MYIYISIILFLMTLDFKKNFLINVTIIIRTESHLYFCKQLLFMCETNLAAIHLLTFNFCILYTEKESDSYLSIFTKLYKMQKTIKYFTFNKNCTLLIKIILYVPKC